MKQLTLRVPDELHGRLREAAALERRSMHAQILWLLERVARDDMIKDPR